MTASPTEMNARLRQRMHAQNNFHRVAFTIKDGEIAAQIICTGGDDAICHAACEHCGENCTTEGHELIFRDTCLWVEWMTYNVDPIIFHASDNPQTIKNGGIIVWWDADEGEFLWTYKEVARLREAIAGGNG